MDSQQKTEVFQFTKLIEYQQGTIVSRQILKVAGGNITLVAFDKGQELSEHTSPFDALVQIIEGEMGIMIAGIPYSLSGGDSIIMPANIPHALKASNKNKMLLTMIHD
jgi:quercetin dioxygenase-like cupin family protein